MRPRPSAAPLTPRPNQCGNGAGTHLGHSAADLVEQSGIPADPQGLHERIVIVGAHHHHVVMRVPVGDQEYVRVIVHAA